MPKFSQLDLWMNILAWSSFLILTGAVVGQLTTRLKNEVEQVRDLNRNLEDSQARIEQADKEIRDHAENLEQKVLLRTESLEKSKHAVEDLKKKVEDALYSTMDASVVRLIIEKRLRTEKRRISILFSDLKDFTQFSEERRPELVITDLNRLLEEMEEVLLDYRAHIEKYMGDGIMVEFGAPVDYQRHALMATIAGLKMQERISKGDYPRQMRVEISTGEPIIGLIGNRRQTYTAIWRRRQSGFPDSGTVLPRNDHSRFRYLRGGRPFCGGPEKDRFFICRVRGSAIREKDRRLHRAAGWKSG